MYVAATAPRSIGGVLDDAIQLYKASFVYCWLPGLIFGALSIVLSLFLASMTGPQPTPAQTAALLRSPHVLMGYGAYALSSALLYCVMISSINAIASGAAPTLGGSIAVGLRSFPGAFIGSIVFWLAVLVGTVLLIAPGIFVWNALQFWIVVLVAERTGPFTALGTSWRLVTGQWWRSFTILSVVFILLLLMVMFFGFLMALVIAPLHLDIATRLLTTRISTGIWYMLVMPMLLAAMVAVYHDLKLRKEGGDIAARLSRLTPV
jgi:hypothetical protein